VILACDTNAHAKDSTRPGLLQIHVRAQNGIGGSCHAPLLQERGLKEEEPIYINAHETRVQVQSAAQDGSVLPRPQSLSYFSERVPLGESQSIIMGSQPKIHGMGFRRLIWPCFIFCMQRYRTAKIDSFQK